MSKHAGDQVCFRERCVAVEVARKEEDLHRGLQLRTELAQDNGMLFVFAAQGRHAFWMKDTLIPLDMIWLDEDRRVVHMESHVPPCQADPCPVYAPSQNALYVLEVNAGHAAEMGLAVGAQMDFRL